MTPIIIITALCSVFSREHDQDLGEYRTLLERLFWFLCLGTGSAYTTGPQGSQMMLNVLSTSQFSLGQIYI